MQKPKFSVVQMTQMSMIAAISVVLVYFIHIPIIPGVTFLEYDPADVTLIVGAFLYGPISGLILTAIVCIIQGLFVSGESGIIGMIMHFVATGSYVLAAGVIYRRNRKLIGVVIALAAGIFVMTGSMILWNILITPIYMGVSRDAVISMIIPVFLPFNLIKSGANSIFAFILFKSVGSILQRQLKSN